MNEYIILFVLFAVSLFVIVLLVRVLTASRRSEGDSVRVYTLNAQEPEDLEEPGEEDQPEEEE